MKFLIVMILAFQTVEGCSRVLSNKIFARTLDLYVDDHPVLEVFPKGMERTGQAGAQSVKWRSQYGSVVVTSFNRGIVTDGMNEAGLAAHLLFLEEGSFDESISSKPQLSNLYWAQYMLDNCQTVEQALQQLSACQVVGTKLAYKEWPVQLVMEDVTGDSAVVEFIDKKMVVHQGHKVVVANGECGHLSQLKYFKPFGGAVPLPGDMDPLSRFVRLSAYLKLLPKGLSGKDVIEGMFSLIHTVQVPIGSEDTGIWDTRWITVGDLAERVFYFNKAAQTVCVDLKTLNLAEGASN